MAQVIPLDVLPLPMNKEETAWKQYLFYLIAYCDTYHDFAKERKAEGKGRSVNKDGIKDRVGFVKEIIRTMDPEFDFESYLTEILKFKSGTFENCMFSSFTKLLNNPLIDKIDVSKRDLIYAHLRDVFSTGPDQEITIQTMNDVAFTSGAPIIDVKTNIIDITMSAVVYSEATKDRLIGFLKEKYPSCLSDDGKLRIVEDAAYFPRSLFIGKIDENFIKIITTQTKWDPAGLSLSGFENTNVKASDLVSAPSFRALYKNTAGAEVFTADSAYFNQATDKIHYSNKEFTVTKPGPSVNHLFMHMALEAGTASPALKDKYKTMILDSRIDSKKNMVLKILDGAGTAPGRDVRLRELTSSKRSGDQENIHSAILSRSLMITGDEPAFIYAVSNKCPGIFHSISGISHRMRLYIPEMGTDEERAARRQQEIVQAMILESAQLYTIFGATDEIYKGFLKNLKSVIFRKEIEVLNNKESGLILQNYFLNELKSKESLFNNLIKARILFEKFFPYKDQPVIGALTDTQIDALMSNLSEIDDNIGDTIVEGSLGNIRERNALLNAKLSDILVDIPKKFRNDGTKIVSLDPILFKRNTVGLPFIIIRNAGGNETYKIDPGSLFPNYKNVESNIGGIAKLYITNSRITNDRVKDKNIKTIKAALEELDIVEVSASDKVIAEANSIINKLLPPVGVPAVGGRANVLRTLYNGVKTMKKTQNTQKNTRKKTSYKTLHMKISSLDPSSIPFGFLPEEYADLIVYRSIVNDSIHKFLVKSETKETVYDGGAVGDTLYPYCKNLFDNHIEPFFTKHMEDNANATDMKMSMLKSIVGGSFIEDLELMFGEVIGSPEFENASYTSMIKNATSNYNNIMKGLNNSYKDPKLSIRLNEKHYGVTYADVNRIITYYKKNKHIRNDSFFVDMESIFTYLGKLFVSYSDANIVPFDRMNEIMKELPDNLHSVEHKNILQRYIKYALNNYIDVEFDSVAAEANDDSHEAPFMTATRRHAAVAAATAAKNGGSRSRRLRRRRGSPRRRSLRNDKNNSLR